MRKLGKIGVYGQKTRRLQRRISFEAFGLTFKMCNLYKYLGSRGSVTPNINDVQTKVFWENPDRAYDSNYIEIPIGMRNFEEAKMDFSRLGIINPLQDETQFKFHVDDFKPLDRLIIVGDVFELPFFTDVEEDAGQSFWEVVDVDTQSLAEKYIVVVSAVPLGNSRTTREVPVDTGFGSDMGQWMEEAEQEYSDIVPAKELSFDDVSAPEGGVDYRDDNIADFLDDPSKEF